MEILTYRPKYAELPIEGGDGGRLDRGEFPEWANCEYAGVALGEETGSVERRGRAKDMPTVREEFGFLIIPR